MNKKKKGITGQIFKCGYKCPEEKSVYKSHMDGFMDKTLQDFQPLSCSSTIKEDLKPKWSEAEYIDSYINAAIILSKENKKLVTPSCPDVKYAFSKYYYTLPIIYLVRHSVELALKFAIEQSGYECKPTHKVSSLWQAFTNHLPKTLTPNDSKTKKQMQLFINIISSLDDTEISTRYSKSRDGLQTQSQFLLVDTITLSDTCEKFVTAIRNVDFEYIRYHNRKESETS